MIQDGPEPSAFTVREISGEERATWWERSAAVFAPFLEYETKAAEAGRVIPVFVAEPAN